MARGVARLRRRHDDALRRRPERSVCRRLVRAAGKWPHGDRHAHEPRLVVQGPGSADSGYPESPSPGSTVVCRSVSLKTSYMKNEGMKTAEGLGLAAAFG